MVFRFLPHTADIFIEAEGKTLEEAFEETAKGLSQLMFSKALSAKERVSKKISIESEDLNSLLYDFLTQFLIFRDGENLLFSKVKIISLKSEPPFKLEAILSGEEINLQKHKPNMDVKAITYHEMSIEKTKNGYKIKVLVDI